MLLATMEAFPARCGEGSEGRGAMPSVLIVDDDADLSAIVARYLESEGFAVMRAASAEEAYDVLGARPFDLVLLDINLPGDDGFAACEALRRASDVPIVFASARTSETDRIVGLDTGGDDYLPKPYSLRELECQHLFRQFLDAQTCFPELNGGHVPERRVKSNGVVPMHVVVEL